MNFLRTTLNGFLDFIFPKSEKVLILEKLTSGEILSALPPGENIEEKNIIALFDYKHPLSREIVWEVKYRGNRTVAGKLAEILLDVLHHELAEMAVFENFTAPLLIPMPISDKRRNERGYNQTEILAEEMMRRDTEKILKYLPGQLVKHRHTVSQTQTATRSERLSNIKESMHVIYPPSVEGRNIIVLDDVTTTGASFTEAKRALKDAGAKKIICLAVAH